MKIYPNLIVIGLLVASFVVGGLNFALYQPMSQDNMDNEVISEGILVQITTGVRNPGIYKLVSGSLMLDLVNASGGFMGNVDITKVNLLEVLHNYQSISFIDNNRENVDGKIQSSLKINLNTATQKEIESLPGIGEVLAKRIIDARPIDNEANLAKIAGLSQSVIAKFNDLVTY